MNSDEKLSELQTNLREQFIKAERLLPYRCKLCKAKKDDDACLHCRIVTARNKVLVETIKYSWVEINKIIQTNRERKAVVAPPAIFCTISWRHTHIYLHVRRHIPIGSKEYFLSQLMSSEYVLDKKKNHRHKEPQSWIVYKKKKNHATKERQ